MEEPDKEFTDEQERLSRKIKGLKSFIKNKKKKESYKDEFKSEIDRAKALIAETKAELDRIAGMGVLLRDPGKLPPSARKLLEKIGNEKITKMVAVRTPLSSTTKTFLNIISLGQFEKISKKYFDELFHLTLWINDKYNLEKNEVISFGTKNPIKSNSETQSITVNKSLTFNELMENTRKYMGDNNFTAYDAEKNNCQNFLLGILNGNKIGTDAEKKWIKQDTDKVFKEIPTFAKVLGNLATTAGAVASRVLEGEGRPRRLYMTDDGRYYYMKAGKRRFVNVPAGISQKQVVKINIGELVKPKKKRKKRKPAAKRAVQPVGVTAGRFGPPPVFIREPPKPKDDTANVVSAIKEIFKYVPREPTKVPEPEVRRQVRNVGLQARPTRSRETGTQAGPEIFDDRETQTEIESPPVSAFSFGTTPPPLYLPTFAAPRTTFGPSRTFGEITSLPTSAIMSIPERTRDVNAENRTRTIITSYENREGEKPSYEYYANLYRDIYKDEPLSRDEYNRQTGKGKEIGKFSIEELSKYYATEAVERFTEYLVGIKKKSKGILLGSWNNARARGVIYEKALQSDIIQEMIQDEKVEKDMNMIEEVLGEDTFSQNEFNIAYYNLIKDDLPKKDAEEFLAIILSTDVNPTKPGAFEDRFVSSLMDLEDVYGLKINDDVIEKADKLFTEERKLLRGGQAVPEGANFIKPVCYNPLSIDFTNMPIGLEVGNPLIKTEALTGTPVVPAPKKEEKKEEKKDEPQKPDVQGKGFVGDIINLFNPSAKTTTRVLGLGFGMAGGCNGMNACECDMFKEKQEGKGNDVDGLYNDEIEDITDGLKIKAPVIAADEIDEVVDMVNPNTKEFGFIINTNPSTSDGSGTDGYRPGHWMSVFIDNDEDRPSIEFFDPLADPIPESLVKDMEKIIEKLGNEKYFLFKENMVKHQNDDTNTCGHHSIRFLEKRYNGDSWAEASGFNKCLDQADKKEKEIMKSVKKYENFL
jgi:hypothetical protein